MAIVVDVLRGMTSAGLLMLLASSAIADTSRGVEVGVLAGRASTNVYNAGPCPVLLRGPAAPVDECVSNPHYRGHGPTLAGYSRYRVAPSIHMEANLEYAEKGYWDGLDVRLHYLELPVLVRIDPFSEVSPFRGFVFVGLSPSVLVSCRTSGPLYVDGEMQTYSGSCADKPILNPTPHRLDVGVVAGVGLGWAFSFGAFELQARIERGVVDVDGLQESGKTTNDARYVIASFGRHL